METFAFEHKFLKKESIEGEYIIIQLILKYN